MDIKVPTSSRRKALFVVDVQPQTLAQEARALIPFMVGFIGALQYDAYVEANFFADEHSMFCRQGGFLKPRLESGATAPEIRAALDRKMTPRFMVEKNTRSCFKAFNAAELHSFLQDNKIEEAHFIGYDINDCVLASAYEALDLGYFSYVIEELCHHWDADHHLKEAALTIFCRQSMVVSEDSAFRIVSV
jgi:nicotinamidase-related amidase